MEDLKFFHHKAKKHNSVMFFKNDEKFMGLKMSLPEIKNQILRAILRVW